MSNALSTLFTDLQGNEPTGPRQCTDAEATIRTIAAEMKRQMNTGKPVSFGREFVETVRSQYYPGENHHEL